MKCHYEVLCVNQDVSDEELRKSYRRLALQLHPDKNPDNAEEAKTKFQEIQNAYEVLSDPHERAFYDRNRESILHGEEFGSERKEDDVHLYKYFTASCYSGFNDSDTGFYTVYRQVFELLAARDMKYIESENVCIPNFGKSDTDVEDVAEFYGYWQSYCTSISFYWVDKYDIRQASNRWVEKKIERENKKIRDTAKKEFNEEVRSLVAFVRKRDKRWEARKKQLEEKVAENARKQTDLQRQLREERLERMKETFEEQKESLSEYEKQLKEMESQFAEEWGISEEEESEEEDEEDQEHKEDVDLIAKGLYCIACEKVFKSDKAYENHEQSRKHQENQAIITALMEEEEAALSTKNAHEEDKEEQDKHEASDLETSVSTSKKKKKKRKQAKIDIPEDMKARKPLSRKSKRQADDDFTFLLVQKSPLETVPTDAPNIEQNGLVNETPEAEVCEQNEPPEVEVCEQNEPPEAEVCEQNEPPEAEVCEQNEPPEAEVCKQDAPQEESATTKLKGKKAKVAKKAQQKTYLEPKVSHVCSVCNGQFNSKNKLFAHLKSAGHAAIKTSKSKR